MGFFRSGFEEVARTTNLIGELIALITEQEETLTYIGKEGYGLYRKSRIYDEVTLELCRKIDGTLKLIEEKKNELEDAIEESLGPASADTVKGKAKRHAAEYILKNQLEQHKKMLKDDYDELGNRMIWLTTNDQRCITPRIVKLVGALQKLKRDIDWRWDELQERTRNEHKGPMFILVLNMFIVNFFRFTNHTWFRNWVRKAGYFQDRFMERIHKQVQVDMTVPDDEPEPAPATEPAAAVAPRESPDPFRPPASRMPASEITGMPDTPAPTPAPHGPGLAAPPVRPHRPGLDARPGLDSPPGWSRPGAKAPDYHGAPADSSGGAFGPRPRPEEAVPDDPFKGLGG